ncbi:MAG: hypothetical protein Q8N04_12755 [Nitrospira sp.]|nr:hypothetical protein [Nitrospira sp.]
MSQKLLEIEREAIRLPIKDREALAERRFSAWRRGVRTGVPVARAFKQIRKDLGW